MKSLIPIIRKTSKIEEEKQKIAIARRIAFQVTTKVSFMLLAIKIK